MMGKKIKMKEKYSLFNEGNLCFMSVCCESFYNLEIKKRITCTIWTLTPLVHSVTKTSLMGYHC